MQTTRRLLNVNMKANKLISQCKKVLIKSFATKSYSVNKEPKILVIGACGQIGVELVPYLREFHGAENVIATDRKSAPPALLENGPFHYLDVLDMKSLNRMVIEENIGTIIHLAAVLSATGEKFPQMALEVNNLGTENVYNVAIENKLKVFCPSTIAVFGPSSPRDNTPVECILRPTTMYGITKVFAEMLGEYYHFKKGLDFRSLRYPGVISCKALPGGGTTDYAVEIYHEALERGEYNCFLKPDTYLPMIFMPDLLKATHTLLQADANTLKRRVYNLGSMSFTPDQLVTSIKRHIPNFKMSYNPDFRQAIADSWPRSLDDSTSTQDWGWKPEYNIDKMTDAMFDYLKPKYVEKSKTNKKSKK